MRYFIISFDRKVDRQYRDFHEALTKHPRIHRWFHYIKSSYIIGTDMNARELSAHFRSTATQHGLPTRHLVLEARVNERSGLLPLDAWDWFRRQKQ